MSPHLLPRLVARAWVPLLAGFAFALLAPAQKPTPRKGMPMMQRMPAGDGSAIARMKPAKGAPEVKVSVSGSPVEFRAGKPLLQDDSVLVPFRAVLEKMGAKVTYDTATRRVHATQGKRSVELTPGSRGVQVDGRRINVKVAPKEIGGTVYIPLRFVSESLGAKVDYDKATTAVTIEPNRTTPTQMPAPASTPMSAETTHASPSPVPTRPQTRTPNMNPTNAPSQAPTSPTSNTPAPMANTPGANTPGASMGGTNAPPAPPVVNSAPGNTAPGNMASGNMGTSTAGMTAGSSNTSDPGSSNMGTDPGAMNAPTANMAPNNSLDNTAGANGTTNTADNTPAPAMNAPTSNTATVANTPVETTEPTNLSWLPWAIGVLVLAAIAVAAYLAIKNNRSGQVIASSDDGKKN